MTTPDGMPLSAFLNGEPTPNSSLAKWQRGEDIGIPEPLTEPEQPQATGPAMTVTITPPRSYHSVILDILGGRGLADSADVQTDFSHAITLHYLDDTLYRDLDEWCRDAWGCGLIRDWKIER